VYKKWNYRTMMFLIFGAFAGVMASQFRPVTEFDAFDIASRVFAVISTLLIAASSFAASEILTDELENNRTNSRSAAETLKAEIYLYVFKTGPYDTGTDDEKDELAFERLEKVRQATAEIPYLSFTDEINDYPDETMTIDSYIKERVSDQIRWYEKKSKTFQQELRKNKNRIYLFGFAGVVLGSIGAGTGYAEFTSVWIAFFTSASGALAAFVATNRYQPLLISYQKTALRLSAILAKFQKKASVDNESIKRFVAACEEEFARERTEWIQIFSEDSKDKKSDKEPKKTKGSDKS